MDRRPKKPPFPVGTRLRYIGTRQVWSVGDEGQRYPLVEPGMQVVITEVREGTRGTLQPVFYDAEMDEEVLDRTVDGYSVYYVACGQRRAGQVIRSEYRGEWEVIERP